MTADEESRPLSNGYGTAQPLARVAVSCCSERAPAWSPRDGTTAAMVAAINIIVAGIGLAPAVIQATAAR